MCSEAVWWRCHRRIVADHLIARGETVFHLMEPGREDPAALTPGAIVRPDRSVIYPPQGPARDVRRPLDQDDRSKGLPAPLYPVYPTTRNFSGSMMWKLSVTVSRMVPHLLAGWT